MDTISGLLNGGSHTDSHVWYKGFITSNIKRNMKRLYRIWILRSSYFLLQLSVRVVQYTLRWAFFYAKSQEKKTSHIASHFSAHIQHICTALYSKCQKRNHIYATITWMLRKNTHRTQNNVFILEMNMLVKIIPCTSKYSKCERLRVSKTFIAENKRSPGKSHKGQKMCIVSACWQPKT